MPRKGIVTTNPLYWMPLNLQEWLGPLAGGLTAEQKGALMDLLATSWQQQPPCTLPNDPVFLAQKSGLGSRWARQAKRILSVGGFYAAQDGRLVCGWLRELYAEQLKKYVTRSAANAENRSKRGHGQGDLDLAAGTNGGTNGSTNGGTNRTTTGSTNRGTNGVQSKKGEGVAPKGANTLDQPETEKTPDAPAPSGARAGLSTMPPVTDILRIAGVKR